VHLDATSQLNAQNRKLRPNSTRQIIEGVKTLKYEGLKCSR